MTCPECYQEAKELPLYADKHYQYQMVRVDCNDCGYDMIHILVCEDGNSFNYFGKIKPPPRIHFNSEPDEKSLKVLEKLKKHLVKMHGTHT